MRLWVKNVQQVLAQFANNMNKNPDITITLNLNEINSVLLSLQELPAKISNPLSQKITEQAKEFIKSMQQTTEDVVVAE